MADLLTDTEITGAGGEWRASVSQDWDLWGPNGGYLATIALRAAGRHDPQRLPASLDCHFLRGARPGVVEITTQTLKASRRAHSVRVSLSQDDRVILAALVWTVAPGLDGLPGRSERAPAAPGPDELRPYTDLVPPGHAYTEPFWSHIEERPFNQSRHLMWPEDPAQDPVRESWLRFRPQPCYADPFVDAGRAVITADVFPFLAGVIAVPQGPLTHIAPTLSLAVSFHGLQPQSEWLRVRTESPYSGNGLLSGRSMIWGESNELIASGQVQMICQPLAPQA